MRSAKYVIILFAAVAAVSAFAARPDHTTQNQDPQIGLPRDAHNAGDVASSLLSRDSAGRVTLAGALFTGTAVTHEDGSLVERSAYKDGRHDGLSERWYPNGTPSFRAVYAEGRRNGTVETWWPNGSLRSQSQYKGGVPDGIQRQWYQSGALFKELHLTDGREEGLQRAWRENGALYANYEARDGRIFGLKRANLCYELDDEQVVKARTRSTP